jgi:hypothetical protein
MNIIEQIYDEYGIGSGIDNVYEKVSRRYLNIKKRYISISKE